MNTIKVTAFDNKLSQIWDSVVHASKNGNFLHLRDYMDYHAHRFDDQSTIIYKNTKAIAVFPCNKENDCVISHGGLTYGGLIYGIDLKATDVIMVMENVVNFYRSRGCKKLLYKAIPHIFHRYPAEEDLYALYRLGANLSRRDLSTAVLLKSRFKYSDSRMNTIRKAKRNGVRICETNNLNDFHSILAAALAYHGTIPVHTVDELELLKSRFPSKIRLFAAYVEGEMIAGALIYDFENVVHTQYLASSSHGKMVGALDFLLSHLLDEIFNNRDFFSFGISTEQQGSHLNEGLIFQKEGFGGRAIVHDFYELEL